MRTNIFILAAQFICFLAVFGIIGFAVGAFIERASPEVMLATMTLFCLFSGLHFILWFDGDNN